MTTHAQPFQHHGHRHGHRRFAGIVVQQPAGINLTNGVNTNYFGSVAIGSNSNLTFIITNIGTANLTVWVSPLMAQIRPCSA